MRIYRPLSKIKAMTFDLDDTLYDNGPIIQHANRELAKYLELHHPALAQMPASQWRQIRQAHIQQDPRLVSDVALLRLLTLESAMALDIADEAKSKQAAQACYDHFYAARSDFTLSDEVALTLEKLANKYPLIGITNGNADTDKVGLTPYFDNIYHASVARPMKPHRHMFDEAATELKLCHSEILHVGDNLEKDVMGAIKAGMQTAWFAADREMNLNTECATVLPHIQLSTLEDLLLL